MRGILIYRMLNRYAYNNLVWVDLESPTKDEVSSVAEEFHLDPLVAQELIMPTERVRLESFENCLYLILHFPVSRHSHSRGTAQEVDFVIGRSFIITTHYDTVDPLHKFSRLFEVERILDKRRIGDHAGYIFFVMIRQMYRFLHNELEIVDKTLQDIESHVFEGRERDMVFAISNVSRILFDFRQTTLHHKEVLTSFASASKAFFGDDFVRYAEASLSEYNRASSTILSHIDLLRELRETNNALLTTKQNETMKHLTMMAFVTFPLTLIAAIFSIDAVHRPIIGTAYDFWIVIAIMGAAALAMYIFFKRRNWL